MTHRKQRVARYLTSRANLESSRPVRSHGGRTTWVLLAWAGVAMGCAGPRAPDPEPAVVVTEAREIHPAPRAAPTLTSSLAARCEADPARTTHLFVSPEAPWRGAPARIVAVS